MLLSDGYLRTHIAAPARAVMLRAEVYYQVFKKDRGIMVSKRYLWLDGEMLDFIKIT